MMEAPIIKDFESLMTAIDGANGEIRMMNARYGGGWLVCLTIREQPDEFWGAWENLVGGDPDMFAARDLFNSGYNAKTGFHYHGYAVFNATSWIGLNSSLISYCQKLFGDGHTATTHICEGI